MATETEQGYVANKQIYHMVPSRNCQLSIEILLLPILPICLTIQVEHYVVYFLNLVLELLNFCVIFKHFMKSRKVSDFEGYPWH